MMRQHGSFHVHLWTICLLAGVAGASASAQDPGFVFSGTVGSAPNALPAPFDQVEAGDPWTLRYCVDLATPDSNPDPSLGQYNNVLTNVVLTIGGASQSGVLNGVNMIQVQNDFTQIIVTSDRYRVWFELPGPVIGMLDLYALHLGTEPVPVMQSDLLPPCDGLPIFPNPPQLTIYAIDATPGVLAEAGPPACGECVVPECLLVLGPPGSGAVLAAIGHEFTPQMAAVEQAWPVTLEDGPEFVIWEAPAPARAPLVGLDPTGPRASPLLDGKGTAAPQAHEALPQVFAAQVLMWNPQAFPSNPEQSSHGLLVTVLPGGRVVSLPYGTSDGGLEIWAEVDWNAQGQKVLRLPFSIPGF